MSGDNLYYTETKKDMIVLGATAIKNVVRPIASSLDSENCFVVENSERDEWDLCAKN